MKKNKMRGLILFATLVTMVLCFTGCGRIGLSSKPYHATITDTVRLRTDSTYSKADSVIVITLDVENKSKDYLDPDMIAYQSSATLDGSALDYEYLTEYCPVYVSTTTIAPKEHGTVQLAYRLGSPDASGDLSLLLLHTGKKKTSTVFESTIDLDDVDYHVIPADYGLEIDRAFTTDDGEGTSLLVLDMTFTNNSEEATSPSAARLTLFQNGIALDTDYLPYNHPEDDDDLSNNSYTDIQPGKSISYRQVYALQDDSDVEFTAKQMVYNGYEVEPILETTITVAEDATEAPDTIVAEALEVSSAFEIEITDYAIGADKYSDIPIVVFLADFTNNSSETAQFSYCCDVAVSQNGVSLEKDYISGLSSYNTADIAPGATGTVILIYELKDPESDIDIVITDDEHYANPVILEESYTLEEIIDSTVEKFGDEEEVLDEDSLEL